MASYYEELCKRQGVKLPFYIWPARNADKLDARKRRKLRKMGQE